MHTRMSRVTRSFAIMVALLVTVAGCRSMTGRSAGQWIEDKQIAAKVKTAIATTKVGTLTRVDVDARDGIVYLTGVVQDQQTATDIFTAARSVPEARRVVNNLTVARAAAAPAASPRTTPATGQAQPQVAAAAPPITSLRFSRMEAESAAGGTQRFAAYDAGGKRVATVYVVPASELRQDALTSMDAGEQRIDHVSIYPHPGSDGMQYHVVLWHVDRSEAARMQ